MEIKKITKFLWGEFIYGGHLLSFGASGILCFSAIILNQKISIPLLILGYLISQITYFYNHFKELKKDFLTNFQRTQHIQKSKKYFLIIFGFYWGFFFLCLIYINNLAVILLSLFIISGGLLYTIFLKNLSKKIIEFKSFYVSFFWALSIILIGFYYNVSFSLLLSLLFSFVFLRWLMNTIFFNIKDIESDKKENLKTLAILFGKHKTIDCLHIINIFSFVPIIIGVYTNLLPLFSLFILIFYFYSFYYLEKAKKEKTQIHNLSYIMVDGEYLLWPFILLLGKIIINL
ncbi:UbiA family prenyltransferase [Candidatus Parcubacteria bacterium]|nr:UbiA family prenyltransferase [Candidatus Parcubacteria bacterium]